MTIPIELEEGSTMTLNSFKAAGCMLEWGAMGEGGVWGGGGEGAGGVGGIRGNRKRGQVRVHGEMEGQRVH